MIVLDETVKYSIFGLDISLTSEETVYGLNTVAEISLKDKDDELVYYLYLGSELPNIYSAVWAWEDFSGRSLTFEELVVVMKDYNLTQYIR